MGLFSRHKNTEAPADNSKSAAPAMDNKDSKSSTAAPAEMPKLDDAPKSDIPPMGTLSSPPVPKMSNALDEIKSEVSQEPPKPQMSAPSKELVPQNGNVNAQSTTGDSDSTDDSLFDFSGSDLFSEADSQEMTNSHSSSHSNLPMHQEASPFDMGPDFDDGAVDTHMEKTRALSFEGNLGSFKKKENENFFMTTQQFKGMVELVEQVKARVKDSSDRHLRLLDIKSEEDVEYENLRRDFQFVEDKLYELDSVIFNK